MWSVEPGERLVYGVIAGMPHGVVMPEREAERVRVLLTARTWGELRSAIDAGEVARIAERYPLADPESEPGDDQPFIKENVHGWHDLDWPDWPQQRMGDWLPADLLAEFIRPGTSAVSGEYLALPAARVDELAERLEARGHPCRRDDALITLVSRG